jgi:hypothetical protein
MYQLHCANVHAPGALFKIPTLNIQTTTSGSHHTKKNMMGSNNTIPLKNSHFLSINKWLKHTDPRSHPCASSSPRRMSMATPSMSKAALWYWAANTITSGQNGGDTLQWQHDQLYTSSSLSQSNTTSLLNKVIVRMHFVIRFSLKTKSLSYARCQAVYSNQMNDGDSAILSMVYADRPSTGMECSGPSCKYVASSHVPTLPDFLRSYHPRQASTLPCGLCQ